MNCFLDTSSLIKLYDHSEAGASTLQQQLDPLGVIYLSTLAQVEFTSALYRKHNRQELSLYEVELLQKQLESEADTYGWVEQNAAVRDLAKQLLAKHSNLALRALDAIQLASALAVRADIQAFFTHDKRLHDDAAVEGLPVR